MNLPDVLVERIVSSLQELKKELERRIERDGGTDADKYAVIRADFVLDEVERVRQGKAQLAEGDMGLGIG